MPKLLKTGVILASLSLAACNHNDTAATAAAAAHESSTTTAADGTGSTSSAERGGTAAATAEKSRSGSAVQSEEVTVPAGTVLPVVLDTAVASDKSRVEEPVHAHLSRAVTVHGETALPEGSRVSGVVTAAERSGRVKGRAHLAIRFTSIVPRGEDERYPISTPPVARTAAATKEKDALKIAAPAAGGALIGRLVGGRKGALVGAGVGGGAGTAYVLSTRGEEVRMAHGSALTLRLTEPLTVKVAAVGSR